MPLSKAKMKARKKEERIIVKPKSNLNTKDVTLLSRPNGEDYNPGEKLYNVHPYPNGTLRYLGPMTDGQVLDRLSVPDATPGIHRIRDFSHIQNAQD